MTGAAGTSGAASTKSMTGRRRSAARLAAVLALYEMDMAGAEADQVLEEFLQKRWRHCGAGDDADETAPHGGEDTPDAATMTEPDNEFLGDLVHGVSTRRQELDGLIAQALSGERTVDRLETLLRVILRGGAYELSSKPDVPAAVVITEYLDVAHAFFDDKGVSLVNGVLDRLAHNLRAGEF